MVHVDYIYIFYYHNRAAERAKKMNNPVQDLIPVLSSLAERAYNDGWFSLEYLAGDSLHPFISESERRTAEILRSIPVLIPGIELLLSSPENAQLEHFLQESLTGNDTAEELLIVEFLRCVSRRMNGAETCSRLQQILK